MLDSTENIGTIDGSRESKCRNGRLDPVDRFRLAMQALDHSRSVTDVAAEEGVSRKCVYEQKHRAERALREAMVPDPRPPDFRGSLNLTSAWRDRAILSAALHTHGCTRGICDHLEAITGLSVSEGTVSNVLRQAAAKAKTFNEAQDLSTIREGAHDEIFAQGVPVLVGVDPRSFFVYGLEASAHRDAASWWVFLAQRSERQGLRLRVSVSDGAHGIRAGVAEAFPGIEQRGDILHAQMSAGDLLTFLENRAYARLGRLEEAERRMVRAKNRSAGHRYSKRLALARTRARDAVALHDDVRILLDWLAEQFALVGPPLIERRETYDWLLRELEVRQGASHRIPPVVRYLRSRRNALLAFVPTIEQGLAQIAGKRGVSVHQVEAIYRTQPLAGTPPASLSGIQADVNAMLDGVLRASSAVENINSILAGYFYLRRSHVPEFLHLLQFYLNHRRFRRSERPERVGKSPRELLTGQSHPDWLELLGYPPVQLLN
jgi:hypothetical protein